MPGHAALGYARAGRRAGRQRFSGVAAEPDAHSAEGVAERTGYSVGVGRRRGSRLDERERDEFVDVGVGQVVGEVRCRQQVVGPVVRRLMRRPRAA